MGPRMDGSHILIIVGLEDLKEGHRGAAVHPGIIRIRGREGSSHAPTAPSAVACTSPSEKEGKKSK